MLPNNDVLDFKLNGQLFSDYLDSRSFLESPTSLLIDERSD